MTARPEVKWEYKTTTRYNKVATGEVTSPTATIAFVEHMRDEAAPEGMLSAAHRMAEDMATWAKQNHGWNNVTGRAEAGLFGEAGQIDQHTFYARLQHDPSVEYAVYLEADPRTSVVDKARAFFGPRGGEYMAREIQLEIKGRGSKFRSTTTGRFA